MHYYFAVSLGQPAHKKSPVSSRTFWTVYNLLSLEFLEGRAQPEDIHICLNREGRPSGEAYVGFHTDEDYANSKQKHKQNMGSRYIEVYDRYILSSILAGL